MDEGQPISYQVLDVGIPVIASDGTQVGTVASVVAAEEEDIFHGILIETPDRGVRLVEAAAIASLHERGVDLRIDAEACAQLPPPEHAAPVFGEDPSRQQSWRHWAHRLTGRKDWDRRS